MSEKGKTIGQAELDLLIYIAESGPVTVRQAQEAFGEARGYVRTTVAQMMERLRAKGYLTREQGDSGLEYSSPAAADQIRQEQLQGFVTATLQGSPSPLVAFLAQVDDISDDDLQQLRQIVEQAKRRRGGA